MSFQTLCKTPNLFLCLDLEIPDQHIFYQGETFKVAIYENSWNSKLFFENHITRHKVVLVVVKQLFRVQFIFVGNFTIYFVNFLFTDLQFRSHWLKIFVQGYLQQSLLPTHVEFSAVPRRWWCFGRIL